MHYAVVNWPSIQPLVWLMLERSGSHEAFATEYQNQPMSEGNPFAKLTYWNARVRETGIKVRTQRITFSQISAEVLQMVRGYDVRHAKVEVHRALYDPDSDILIDTPHLILRGYVDKLKLPTPAKGQRADLPIEIATAARALTKPLSRYRSNAGMLVRAPVDPFRKYASVADVGDVKWGA